LSKSFLPTIRVRKHTDPAFRVYLLGEDSVSGQGLLFDAVFPSVPGAADFVKKFVETLALPATIRLLVVVDEEEIALMVRDYFEGRKAPAFEIDNASDGEEALKKIALNKPTVILLDIKMPVMDGREFYARLQKQNPEIPVIVFFDSVSGEELSEIRRYGNPAVVEKGYKGSSLSSLMLLAKKSIYFGSGA
jgi:CheY-like chemotaxis protein